jgi:branched-chain amino acid transport system permease protein
VALQLGLNALTLAACYALLALGFVLVLNATGAVNFAQGDLVMAGGFVAAALADRLPLPGILLLPVVLAAMAGLGLAVAALGYFPLRDRPPEAVFISTIAIGVMLQNGATLLFGPEPRAAPPLLAAGTQGVAMIGVAAVLIAALHVTLSRTQLGRRLRATAQDRAIAAALGVRVNRMVAGSFALGAALAGAGGMLLANLYFVTPDAGGGFMLKAYGAAVIGGWGSIPGAVAGAALMAAFEVLYPSLPLLVPGASGAVFSDVGATVALDVVILLILALRPRGLFGEAYRQRA